MKRKSTRVVRKDLTDIVTSSPEELDRLQALPEGIPDAENPEWTPQQLAAADKVRRRRILERAGRGRKTRITINLDEDLLAYFKAVGKQGYQTRINDALRAYIAQKRPSGGKARDLIGQAKSALEEAERMLEREEAA